MPQTNPDSLGRISKKWLMCAISKALIIHAVVSKELNICRRNLKKP